MNVRPVPTLDARINDIRMRTAEIVNEWILPKEYGGMGLDFLAHADMNEHFASTATRRLLPTMGADGKGGDVDGDRGSVVLLDVLGEDGAFDRSILERLGHPVEVCSGPEAGQRCPLLGGPGCEKFERAHGIVFELDLDRAQHRAIVQRYRDLAPESVPIRVVVRPDQQERYASLLAQVEVWDHMPTVADLDGFAASVEAAER